MYMLTWLVRARHSRLELGKRQVEGEGFALQGAVLDRYGAQHRAHPDQVYHNIEVASTDPTPGWTRCTSPPG